MPDLGLKNLAHIHIIVPDLDEAAEFYREVMGFLEMQSHHGLVNRGLATYYGFEEIWDRLNVSLRFLIFPDVLTIKLVQIKMTGYGGRASLPTLSSDIPYLYGSVGTGPISVVAKDLDATYRILNDYASNYSSKFKITLLSEPVFMSPILPSQTGATEYSQLRGQARILRDLADKFPQRAKFQLIDPFGIRWEFNNDID
ncbi:MAG TPA: VOC family protein [Nodularia sp. (in: cyanobacteria)]|nr:VOC family protein [Nodularia sp. (in: cyanobacteria)]